MNLGQDKLFRRWLYQIHLLIDNDSADNFYKANGARAVRSIICGFEVYRYEIHFRFCQLLSLPSSSKT
jgi:hypothetical protein